jgi:hypothetical protein
MDNFDTVTTRFPTRTAYAEVTHCMSLCMCVNARLLALRVMHA